MGVAEEFTQFKNAYNIDKELISSIASRYQRITGQLNKDFRDTDSKTANSLYVGSYGRDTSAKGISDLDMAYTLPGSLYYQYDAYTTNGQSALLQAVKKSIQNTYTTSESFGDGQVVVVKFTDGITFEVLPVFDNKAGTWTYPNANNGGSWQICNPRAEIEAIHIRNLASNRNLKHLCRMMRVWRDHNDAPMSGALVDTLAYQFIETWAHRDKSFLYHDYMARDFLKYLCDQDKDKSYWRMPGSSSYVWKKGNFQSKALIDYNIAVAACGLLKEEEGSQRRAKWRSVFGPTFPN
ncbi:SMODS domain-containing nucleotidyltransferase [Rhizobium ruizarguesonis]|uniref:SMODS domain-containing nucleotidyltransferase n=1 Tax=Rhizobium ruizarguesonis TaxID=2081791 RepID=UPI0010326ED7|nr:nucleotidyltransferase [Rhizobium ruizarguesonis]TAW57717.1 nucleotidyltransferase [Rhizobium ruizarguesonis]TBC79236.1 nucleotidyltransferase [Rhizobium ruizarguesonis]TBC84395.1 nucleotidyltransferase [Rhizobium ruizarguesonis]TBD48409.1 nucleotidyltransferase [Rhizobium ruizarguesonis]TBD69523.1 nucleotidyltransferase [Rhizobium ruizarguesonis]